MRNTSFWTSVAISGVLFVLPIASLIAHPGGLNAAGCHNDRQNGGYHCHSSVGRKSNGSRSSAPDYTPATPRQSLSGKNGRDGSGGTTAANAYRNCSEARAAGATPVRIGQAGYGKHLDRDGDGVACE